MVEVPVQLEAGDRAVATGYASNLLSLICPCAYPPGKPMALRAEIAGTRLSLEGKSTGSRVREDGRFDVKLRLVSLRREDRALLEQLFAQP